MSAVERSRSPTLHSANTLEGSRRKLADLGRPAAMTQDANPEHRPIAREREGEASMIRRLVPTAALPLLLASCGYPVGESADADPKRWDAAIEELSNQGLLEVAEPRGRRELAGLPATELRAFAESGDVDGRWYTGAQADAQSYVGLQYLNGDGVTEDGDEAARWLRLAADQGHTHSQTALGIMYNEGRGVPQDADEAVRWLRPAAAQGQAEVQFSLASNYRTGRGVAQDGIEAIRLYRLAAAQGLASAQQNVGVMYFQGEGVPQDYVEAHMWFNLAAAQYIGSDRDELAVQRRDAVALLMTADQLAEAQRRAREWSAERETP